MFQLAVHTFDPISYSTKWIDYLLKPKGYLYFLSSHFGGFHCMVNKISGVVYSAFAQVSSMSYLIKKWKFLPEKASSSTCLLNVELSNNETHKLIQTRSRF